MQKTFRVQNGLLSPNDFQYDSEVKLDFSMYHFQYGDYASLVSARMKNVKSNSGFLYVERTQISDSTVTKNYYEMAYEPQNYKDVMFFVNNIANQNQSDALLNIAWNSQTKNFSIKTDSTTHTIKIQCIGNIQNLLGLRTELTLTNQYQNLSLENSTRIEFIKLCCSGLDGSLQLLGNKQRYTFSSDTVCVLQQTKSFYQFSNKNLDVHMKILQTPSLTFKILDQDNREVKLSYCYLEIQLLTQEFFRSINKEPHMKKQLFYYSDKPQFDLQFNDSINKICLSDISGRIPEITFTPYTTRFQILKYDYLKHATKYNNMRPYAVQIQAEKKTNNWPLVYYNYQDTFSQDPDDYFAIFQGSLFDQPEFIDYKNKLIDYNFFEKFYTFFNRIFDQKLDVEFIYDMAEDKLQIKVANKKLANLNRYDHDYFIFFMFTVDENNILYDLIPENKYFRFSNLWKIKTQQVQQKSIRNILDEQAFMRYNQDTQFFDFYNNIQPDDKFYCPDNPEYKYHRFQFHQTMTNLFLTFSHMLVIDNYYSDFYNENPTTFTTNNYQMQYQFDSNRVIDGMSIYKLNFEDFWTTHQNEPICVMPTSTGQQDPTTHELQTAGNILYFESSYNEQLEHFWNCWQEFCSEGRVKSSEIVGILQNQGLTASMNNDVLTLTSDANTAYLIELIYLDEDEPAIGGDANIIKTVHIYNGVLNQTSYFSDTVQFIGRFNGDPAFCRYVDYTNLYITSKCQNSTKITADRTYKLRLQYYFENDAGDKRITYADGYTLKQVSEINQLSDDTFYSSMLDYTDYITDLQHQALGYKHNSTSQNQVYAAKLTKGTTSFTPSTFNLTTFRKYQLNTTDTATTTLSVDWHLLTAVDTNQLVTIQNYANTYNTTNYLVKIIKPYFRFIFSRQKENTNYEEYTFSQYGISDADFIKSYQPVTRQKYNVNSIKMFRYSSIFNLFCSQVKLGGLLGTIISDDLVIEPFNKSVFTWDDVQPTNRLNMIITTSVENENGKIVQQSDYSPELIYRFLVKKSE